MSPEIPAQNRYAQEHGPEDPEALRRVDKATSEMVINAAVGSPDELAEEERVYKREYNLGHMAVEGPAQEQANAQTAEAANARVQAAQGQAREAYVRAA